MKKLDVPLTGQPANSFECGIAASKMLLDYYGQVQPYETVKQNHVNYDPTIGLYSFDVGSFFLRHGFAVDIVTLNTNFLHGGLKGASQDKIRDHVTSLLDQNGDKPEHAKLAKGLRYLLTYMDDGGTVTIAIPTADMIKAEIDQDRPVGLSMTIRFLYDMAEHVSHFVVISGYDDTHFYINDPDSFAAHKVHRHAIDDIMYGLHANVGLDPDNGVLIKIRPHR